MLVKYTVSEFLSAKGSFSSIDKCSSFFNLIFYLLETIKNIYKIDVTV